jgi:hypothetical protein
MKEKAEKSLRNKRASPAGGNQGAECKQLISAQIPAIPLPCPELWG